MIIVLVIGAAPESGMLGTLKKELTEEDPLDISRLSEVKTEPTDPDSSDYSSTETGKNKITKQHNNFWRNSCSVYFGRVEQHDLFTSQPL